MDSVSGIRIGAHGPEGVVVGDDGSFFTEVSGEAGGLAKVVVGLIPESSP
jgi:hypothetical protein